MKKIDRETVSRIIDAADIVEVVSEFVTLRRRGANYMGLCPFHSERTPSFSVSKAKGICKCFSCGKGGSPVNFLMELEQMSFQEALRWLAKKYNIPIKEQEETEQDRQLATERESLYAVNSFALQHFEKNLHETDDGRDIGLAYFKERGLTEETIRKFQLGYALEKSDALFADAVKNGFSEDFLYKAGLCAPSDRRAGGYDRFRGRVIYPVHTLSGKIVAFGGRTLKTDKSIAKYVNSPESLIYSKSRELYGLFQARRAIVKEDKCILVEGYMDVLSMSQSGVENVVASSGTSLTQQQVNIIHRFTNNVTVIYDSDAAGIKASLRGVDMLLAEGMNVKVVLFPEGEDPDSYARSHSRQELADYIVDNETDFIRFKTSILLKDSGNDPMKRSQAINDILRSIAIIPDTIVRQVYLEECARTFNMDGRILALQVNKLVKNNAEREFENNRKAQTAATLDGVGQNENKIGVENQSEAEGPNSHLTENIGNPIASPENISPIQSSHPKSYLDKKDNPLYKYEKNLMRYIVRYGLVVVSTQYIRDEAPAPFTVLDYVRAEFTKDNTYFTDETLSRLYGRILELEKLWNDSYVTLSDELEEKRDILKKEGFERIRRSAPSMSEIIKAEKDLDSNIRDELAALELARRLEFISRNFLWDDDDDVRSLVTEFVSDKYTLSKYHSKFTKVETEQERLNELLPRALYELKDAILQNQILHINRKIASLDSADPHIPELIAQLMEKIDLRKKFARFLGERIVIPSLLL